MKNIVIEPTQAAHWHTLVCEAEEQTRLQLGETCESYLVFMLMRFTDKPEITDNILGLEFLNGLQEPGQLSLDKLRNVGDKCLLFSGLFPNIARRRMVRVSYFVNLGRSAYHQLRINSSQQLAELYAQLSDTFVPMMDVLQAMRENNDHAEVLDALSAYDLWEDTDSLQALKSVKSSTTTDTPIITGSNDAIKH